ncbi:hypothetical protein BMR86_11550 [Stenotrophomonas sp. KAs 5-3]|nr:hypothetical protein BMR86_11550 [Stenotrophomonas sp. KAs 5-3]
MFIHVTEFSVSLVASQAYICRSRLKWLPPVFSKSLALSHSAYLCEIVEDLIFFHGSPSSSVRKFANFRIEPHACFRLCTLQVEVTPVKAFSNA